MMSDTGCGYGIAYGDSRGRGEGCSTHHNFGFGRGYGDRYGTGQGQGDCYARGDGFGYGWRTGGGGGYGTEQPAAVRLLGTFFEFSFYVCQLHTISGEKR